VNNEELRAVLEAQHKPELAKCEGMVWQVWDDGEVTLQKSGELLWQRTLHQQSPGFLDQTPIELWPDTRYMNAGQKLCGFVFTDAPGTRVVLEALYNWQLARMRYALRLSGVKL
jgi:hypothetical protein